MSLSIILAIYAVLAGILLVISLVVLGFTWRFRYLGPATYPIIALFITAVIVNILLVTWYILRTDWTYAIGFDLSF